MFRRRVRWAPRATWRRWRTWRRAIGEGEFLSTASASTARWGCERAGLAPLRLLAKEGLALINGTQMSTALALHALFASEAVFASALVTGALTVDAAQGSDGPFDPRIHAVRGQPGQIDVARVYRRCCRAVPSASRTCESTGCRTPIACAASPRSWARAWTSCASGRGAAARGQRRDRQPAGLRRPGRSGSGGNFHAEPVALAADEMAVAIAEVGAIAERRIAMLIDASVSRLPPFLSAEPGLNSGFMIAHVTAASLASENKSLAHPASVDSLPTSANQEDHVSMATFAARRLQRLIDNTAHILGIELLASAQALEFLRPLRSSGALEGAHALLRRDCPPMPHDRYIAPDIERATALVRSGAIAGALHAIDDLPAWWTGT